MNEEENFYDLMALVKESLSIYNDSSLKDYELELWIRAAIEDLSRVGIAAATVSTDNWLVKGAIVMFCKANFGMCSLEEKKLAQSTYSLLCNNLALSYKEGASDV